MKIYVMGNILVEKDSLPVLLLPSLKKEYKDIDFVEFDPSEDFVPENKTLTIIDTVLDIDKVILFHDINRINVGRVYSLHDFDLGYNLKLMKKFHMLDTVNIIGVPSGINKKGAIQQIKEIITSLSSGSE